MKKLNARIDVTYPHDARVIEGGPIVKGFFVDCILLTYQNEAFEGCLTMAQLNWLAREWVPYQADVVEVTIRVGLLRLEDSGCYSLAGYSDRYMAQAKEAEAKSRGGRHRSHDLNHTEIKRPDECEWCAKEGVPPAEPPTKPVQKRKTTKTKAIPDDDPWTEKGPSGRPLDPHWEGLKAWLGTEPKTDSERGRWNKAIQELRKIDVTEADVVAHGRAYDKLFPGMDRNPNALVANWSKLEVPPPAPERHISSDCPARETDCPDAKCVMYRNRMAEVSV